VEPDHAPSTALADDAVEAAARDGTARVAMLRSGDRGWVLVRPNRSLNRTGLVVAAAACVAALLPATVLCLSLGAWPMLPFLGLEIAVAIGAFAWLARHHDDHERVVLDPERVLHVRVHGPRREVQSFPRHWVRLTIEPGEGARRPQRLWLGSHGRRVELGRDGSVPTRAVLSRTLTREFGISRSHVR
jgi:uncharacterized membrane protein